MQVSTHSPVNYPILQVADQVAQGKRKAGAIIVRPHGHHAEADAAMGFCLFKNVAVCTLSIIRSIDIWSVAPCIYWGRRAWDSSVSYVNGCLFSMGFSELAIVAFLWVVFVQEFNSSFCPIQRTIYCCWHEMLLFNPFL